MPQQLPILFSGIQPSGELSIAHYLGVIKHWLRLQDTYDCLFSVVDLHAITVKQSPQQLRTNSLDLTAWYLACGLKAEQSTIFLQSQVAEHSQLSWILNCNTHMGELNRMTQFKDKSQRFEKNINLGLFAYPVLMAADILLYGSAKVPVGDDQKQHLELARDIALRFNNIYGDIFTVPDPVIATKAARIMSLQDPSKKMSKSDPNKNSTILLSENATATSKKIKRAVTDSLATVKSDANRPGITNLIELYHAVTDTSIADIESRYEGQGYGQFKKDLAEILNNHLAPIRAQYLQIRQDEDYLREVLHHGGLRARQMAQQKLAAVMAAIGFVGG